MVKTGRNTTERGNPFLGRNVEVDDTPEPSQETVSTDLVLGEQEEQKGPQRPVGVPSQEVALTITETEPAPGVTVVGLHGGSGASTVTALLAARGDVQATERAATDVPAGSAVVCVARTSGVGCEAARRAASQWGSGDLELDVLGLVLVPDGVQTPAGLRKTLRQVAAMWPRTWSVGWVPQWHLSAVADPATAPRRARGVAARISKAHQKVRPHLKEK